jgi:hypothetical protein
MRSVGVKHNVRLVCYSKVSFPCGCATCKAADVRLQYGAKSIRTGSVLTDQSLLLKSSV